MGIRVVGLLALVALAACQTERGRSAPPDAEERADEAAPGEEAAPKGEMARLQEAERAGQPVHVQAVMVGKDDGQATFRLSDGELLGVAVRPETRFRRGTETVTVEDLATGTTVEATYRLVGNERVLDEVVLLAPENGRAPGEREEGGGT